MDKELTYVSEEAKAEVEIGPRDFYYVRKISLGNYDPKKRYETEDYGVTHDSFKEAREVVESAVKARIAELTGIKEHTTKK